MRIASFIREGEYDCGLVDTEDRIRLLDGIPELASISRPARLAYLLGLSAAQRRQLSALIALEQQPVVSPASLAPAIPLCPLYLVGHGNSPTIWRRQSGAGQRWNESRITMFRVRPWTSLAGHNEVLEVPLNAALNHGAELGVVIGKAAHCVPEEQAADHIAGLVVLNDLYLCDAQPTPPGVDERTASHFRMSRDCLRKAADGCGAMGPWITTIEQLEDDYLARVGPSRLEAFRRSGGAIAPIYDLLMHTWQDGRLMDRAFTGALLSGPEYMIAYLSRFMTLPTGTVIGLGAPGWDGVSATLGPDLGDRQSLAAETEQIGRLETHLQRVETQEQRRHSPCITRRRILGLPTSPNTFEKRARSIWICRGNDRSAADREGIAASCPYNPLLYPPGVLADLCTPVTLSPHMTDIECEVHLAGVIGRVVYNPSEEEAWQSLAGVAVLVHLRDLSLAQNVDLPITDYEARSAFFLGGSADGFVRLSPCRPIGSPSDVSGLTMGLMIGRDLKWEGTTGSYLRDLPGLVAWVASHCTLLPGDILSLGPAGAPLVIPAQTLRAGQRLCAEIASVGSVELFLDDRRDAQAQTDNRHALNSRRTDPSSRPWPSCRPQQPPKIQLTERGRLVY